MIIDKLKIIFLILCNTTVCLIAFGQVDLDSKSRSNSILKSLSSNDSEVTLVIVKRSFIKEEIRLEEWINTNSKDSRNFGYMNRKLENLKAEQAKFDAFYDPLEPVLDLIKFFDVTGLIVDTSYNSSLKKDKFQITKSKGQKSSVRRNETIVFLRYGNHPETRKRGLYFYSYDGIYLGESPFPSYIPSHSSFDAFLDALQGAEPKLFEPEKLIRKINKKMAKALAVFNEV